MSAVKKHIKNTVLKNRVLKADALLAQIFSYSRLNRPGCQM
jgi:hypothetical protein